MLRSHLQDTVDTKPPMKGEINGPNIVEAMKTAIALPRGVASLNISAYKPATTVIGQAALMPTNNRNTTNAGQFGATAQAKLKIVNMINVGSTTIFRPNVSLSGPHNKGPKT